MSNQEKIEERELARQQEMDQIKAMYEKKIQEMQQANRTEVEALAAQNRDLVQQLDKFHQAAVLDQETQRGTQEWLSELQKELDEVKASNSMKDETIYNLSRILSR